MYAQYKIVPSKDAGKAATPSRAAVDVDLITRLERAAGVAKARELDLKRKRAKTLKSLKSYWPLAAGLCLAAISPLLRNVVSRWQPWGMALTFPFVVLAARPELHLTGVNALSLQQAMIYVQFPVEGLVARWAIKQRVTFSGVAGQLFFLHLFGAVDLVLLSGVLNQLGTH